MHHRFPKLIWASKEWSSQPTDFENTPPQANAPNDAQTLTHKANMNNDTWANCQLPQANTIVFLKVYYYDYYYYYYYYYLSQYLTQYLKHEAENTTFRM